MAARRSDKDRHLADPNPSEAMPEDDPLGAEPKASRPFEGRELLARRGKVGLVVERLHSAPPDPVGSHAAGEQYDAPQPRTFEGPHCRGRRERSTAQPNAHVHPPPYGG